LAWSVPETDWTPDPCRTTCKAVPSQGSSPIAYSRKCHLASFGRRLSALRVDLADRSDKAVRRGGCLTSDTGDDQSSLVGRGCSFIHYFSLRENLAQSSKDCEAHRQGVARNPRVIDNKVRAI